MHLINLTDGEGFCIPYGREVKRYYEEGTMITKGNIKSNVHLRDRKTSKVYQFSNDHTIRQIHLSTNYVIVFLSVSS